MDALRDDDPLLNTDDEDEDFEPDDDDDDDDDEDFVPEGKCYIYFKNLCLSCCIKK